MNLYTQRIASDEDTRTKTLTLKLDWLGTESKPHFLCTVELKTPERAAPESISLFMLERCHPTDPVTIIARLGRYLILNEANHGFSATEACVRKLAREWQHWDSYAILGAVTGLELGAMEEGRRLYK